ncbi:MAG: M14 family zinc carboxypeptidase [Thermofilum sp.]
MQQAHSNICKTYIIGYTFKGRPIYALKITKTPVLENDRPKALIVANYHAREWMGPAVAMKLAHFLVDNYDSDQGVKYLVNQRETWIIPSLNADGYIYDTGGTPNPNPPGIMWRKNMRDNNPSDGSFTESYDGVDLNRNHPYQWVGGGSSSNPGDETYRGPWPASEPEVQAIQDLMVSRSFLTGVSLHTYSNLVLYPWGYTYDHAPDYNLLNSMASDMTNGYFWNNQYYSGNGYTPEQSSQLYPTNGDLDDWAYGFLGIPFFTFEMTPDSFYYPASYIQPTFNTNKDALLYLIRRANEVTGAVCGKISDTLGNPLWAQVTISPSRPPNFSSPQTGRYSWTMVPGTYCLTISATGYQTISDTVTISAGTYTKKDYTLAPLSAFTLSGTVRDQSGHFLPAKLEVLGTGRLPVYTTPSNGTFQIPQLVPGQYTLKVSTLGYATKFLNVNISGDTFLEIVMDYPASVLLVNDDGWGQSGGQILYYRDSLGRLGIAFQELDTLTQGLPSINQLLTYPQVIWVKSYGGLSNEAQGLLTSYLNSGGRLILSGQDIALSSSSQGDFLTSSLSSSFFSDDPGSRTLNGVAGDPIGNGLTLDINGSGGARDNTYPDAITPTAASSPVFLYSSSGSPAGAVKIDKANYRAVFFSFNWEGISDSSLRDIVLSRSLSWNLSLPNQNPVITSQPPTSALSGQNYQYTITATDPDGDTLSFYSIYYPTGMVLQNNTLTWTPTLGQIGTFPVEVRVRDNKGGWTDQAFSITVSSSIQVGSITLSPTHLSTPVGKTCTVLATVRNTDNAPMPQIPLSFQVSGSHPQTKTLTTDAQGQAIFSYSESTCGTDTIQASAYGVQSNIISNEWVPLTLVDLSITPTSSIHAVNEIFMLTVLAQAGTQPVDRVAVYIDFDPAKIQVVDPSGTPTNTLIPGVGTLPDWFDLQNSADNSSGFADYSAATFTSSITGTFTVCSLRFKALVPSLETSISFHTTLPRKTDIIWSHYDPPTVLGNLNNASLTIWGNPLLALTPTSANLTVGNIHTLFALLSDGVHPFPNQAVQFSVSGANNLTGTATTDSSGIASWSYTGTKAGRDYIISSTNTIFSNQVQAYWSPGSLQSLTLSASTPTCSLGSTCGLKAQALDNFGNPIPGLSITFQVSGAHTLTGTATTDQFGYATWSYMESTPGTDTVQAISGPVFSPPISINWVLGASVIVNFQISGTNPYSAQFTITFYEQGTQNIVLTKTFSCPSNSSGFTLSDIPPGTYDIRLKERQCLSGKLYGVNIGSGSTALNFGSLRLGDINNDDRVNIYDFSILAGSYGKSQGQAGFVQSADLNHDNTVTIYDFSILAGNYGLSGPE